MEFHYPLGFDGRGRTAQTSAEGHIREMIEQVLFTAPGERVNRPTFGSGVLQLVFEPNSDAVAAATQLAVQAALQQWLGELIEVDTVDVQSEDARLDVLVGYTVRRTNEHQVERFGRSEAP